MEKEYLVSESNSYGTGDSYSMLREPMNIHGVTVVWDSLIRLAQARHWNLEVTAGNGFIWLECWQKNRRGMWHVVKELTVRLPESECGLARFDFSRTY